MSIDSNSVEMQKQNTANKNNSGKKRRLEDITNDKNEEVQNEPSNSKRLIRNDGTTSNEKSITPSKAKPD